MCERVLFPLTDRALSPRKPQNISAEVHSEVRSKNSLRVHLTNQCEDANY